MHYTEVEKVIDVWDLSMNKRWQLYKFWLQLYIEDKNKETFKLQKQFRESYKKLTELRILEDAYICKNADVVGMTTTGAAKYKHIVQHIKPTIVIVEEAAEILESHITTSFVFQTQHVILIGDHQQLKPSPTVHLLSKKYDLDVSLFERLIKNGMEYKQLKLQHRMRPDISALLVPHIYPHLENHESILSLENIRGVTKNVFFIHHDYHELHEGDTKSKVNEHEAKFLIKLCKYLILQNYDPSQITVLTTYSGQLFEMKRLSKGVLEGVKLTVVDNYQGEENDIILISFVRSNEDGEIGFLKVSNRVCVALSRAKKGLYCIGNFPLLAENSSIWRHILKVLKDKDCIGPSLQLVCQNHSESTKYVREEKDFDCVQDGGCDLPCEYRLSCGHVCPKKCHPTDAEHENVICFKPCGRTCSEGHLCEKKCFEDCGLCLTPIQIRIDTCGHEIAIACYLKYGKIKCTENCLKVLKCRHEVMAECYLHISEISCLSFCGKLLPCGHKCRNYCSEKCTTQCYEICEITSKVCGHVITHECFRSDDIEYLIDKCDALCATKLPCEHTCKGTCKTCRQGRFHIACNQKCNRILVCGHKCESLCCKSCPLCTRNCENWCAHRKCTKRCGEMCEKCIQPCAWSCPHKQCTRMCWETCDRVPCNEPCPNLLDCQHRCLGFCGEPCPKLCNICDLNGKDEEILTSNCKINERLVVLEDCNHTFGVTSMNKWMNDSQSEKNSLGMIACPECAIVIRKNYRYGNIIKNKVGDSEKVKLSLETLKTKLEEYLPFLVSRAETLNSVYSPLWKTLTSKRHRSVQEILVMRNFIKIIKLYEACIISEDDFSSEINSLKCVGDLLSYMKKTMSWISPFLLNDYVSASELQLQQMSWEMHRITLLSEFIKYVKEVNQSRLPRATSKLFAKTKMAFVRSFCKWLCDNVMTYKSFTKIEMQLVSSEIKRLKNLSSYHFNFKSEINQASVFNVVSFSCNHWYNCEKGHIHFIHKYNDSNKLCNDC